MPAVTGLILADLAVAGVCWFWVPVVVDAGADAPGTGVRLLLAAVVAGTTVGSLTSQEVYRSRAHLPGPIVLARVTRAAAFGLLVAAGVVGVAGLGLDAAGLACAGVAALVGMMGAHRVVRAWRGRRRRGGRVASRTLLVGADRAAYRFWRHLVEGPGAGRVVVGYVGDRAVGDQHRWPLEWLGDTGDAVRVARGLGLDGLVIVPGSLPEASLDVVVHEAHEVGLDVEIPCGLCRLHHRRIVVAEIAHEPVLFVEPRRAGRARRAVKRAFDLGGAAALLVVTAPVFAVVVALILIDEGRPVFYRQVRVGRDRHPFRLWKFRTMEPDADRHLDVLDAGNQRRNGPLFKLADDPRVTRIGRVLRATSIDELPQLFNVLAGSMSLVGPRPALPSEAATFDAELQNRTRVRPGMTGLWQVEARDDPEFAVYRKLDLFYVENWSFGLDLAILAATVPCLLRHAGVRATPDEDTPVAVVDDEDATVTAGSGPPAPARSGSSFVGMRAR